jgi:hypothetical protein
VVGKARSYRLLIDRNAAARRSYDVQAVDVPVGDEFAANPLRFTRHHAIRPTQ